jgi:recombination associated protein RdgC
MWFKNVRVFCLTQSFDLPFEDLEAQLGDNAFIPCANYEKSRIGWVSPLGDAAPELEEDQSSVQSPLQSPMLTHIVGDYIMLCAQQQDRLLPSSVVREATAEKIAEIEASQARKVYRKEKREIQDNMYASLLPRAFTRSTRLYGYISRADKLLIIDTPSATKAEEFINLLRDTLGSFPVALPDSKRAPSDVMTRWLLEQKATDKFELHDDCELFNPLDSSNVVRCKGQELVSDEIKSHLQAGKRVRQLRVMWNNVLSCSITEELSLKQLRFEDIKEESDSFTEETPAQKFDQEFALMTLELSAFFKAFFNAFGGLEDPSKSILADKRSKETV